MPGLTTHLPRLLSPRVDSGLVAANFSIAGAYVLVHFSVFGMGWGAVITLAKILDRELPVCVGGISLFVDNFGMGQTVRLDEGC